MQVELLNKESELLFESDQIVNLISNNLPELFSHKRGNTKRKYISDCAPFVAMLQDKGCYVRVLEDFRNSIENIDKADSTRAGYLIAAKQLLIRLNVSFPELLPDDVFKRMTFFVDNIPVSSDHKKDGLNDKEIKLFENYLALTDDGNKRTRLTAMYVLMAFQGLRQFEVANIKIEHFKYNNSLLSVKGKNKMTEPVYLYPDTVKAIERYKAHWGIQRGYLFFPVSRNGSKSNPLTTRSIRRIFNNIFKELGIEKSTHGFRHWFITKIAKLTNGDAYKTSSHGRIKSIQTTKKYVDGIEAKADLAAFSKEFVFSE